jgi:hypothetical protein
MKNQIYRTVGTVLKSNITIIERGKIDTRPLTFPFGTSTSINSDGVKICLWVQTSTRSEMTQKWFHMHV